jgi:lipopolysaccharide/colanic/teichoic acid biosynthesis glycosyltransferase
MNRTRLVLDLIELRNGKSNRNAIVTWTAERRRFFERKYQFDRVAGTFLLFCFSPAIVALWFIVKLTSKGPGFYRQTRTGLNGHDFEILKLRSMKIDAESDGQAVWCRQQDNRITRIGAILRRLHLDELPQLLNVARGEMALVGPRPERPTICSSLEKDIMGYFDRIMVKPGITGLSQINLESDQSLSDVRRKQILDVDYINKTNRWLEVRILLATALRMFGIKGELVIKWMQLCRRSLLPEPIPTNSTSTTRQPVLVTAKNEQENPQEPSEFVVAEVKERMSFHRTDKPSRNHQKGIVFPHFDNLSSTKSNEFAQ